MNKLKLFLFGSVGLAGLLLTSTAQADDHRRHNGDRHDYRSHDRQYYGQRHYYYAQPQYYYRQPGVIYGNSDYGYYNDGGTGVTIAIGGHRSHRHHHHHR